MVEMSTAGLEWAGNHCVMSAHFDFKKDFFKM